MGANLMNQPTLDQLVRAAKQDVPAIVNTLAQAFHDDPYWKYSIPNPENRRKALERLFRVSVSFAVQQGEVYASSSNFEGVAVWLPPGKSMKTSDAIRIGWWNMFSTLYFSGFQGFGRIMRVLDTFEERQKQDAPPRYWYLMQVGVRPELQSKGFGSQLLTPMLERCDREREMCYLETATPENVGFYQKRGFQIIREAPIKGGGATLWTMVRHPQA
jgi:ribosomal protein S18 acetylase RimI-like enzyme